MDHQGEQDYILEVNEKVHEKQVRQTKVFTWRQLLNFRNTWSIITSRFFIDPIWWMFVTWLPTFLKEQFAFDIRQVGAFAWLPFLFAAIGGLAGGFFSSWLIRKNMMPSKAR